ncbi:S9 family peptidase [Sphingopyxis panaciterrulae]|uniref:Dipeptidyl-peptidase-4 n=1 Tax=Sphingopyxis panaciterrulae TaxID=462372 RepID=A0A7W9B448_9SPHN|nr:S9 family peptidase [Sphingopyxis panaciterrulae]MBB5705880.1 dipeptidyl-peptidase-4 [Sphingopyxis panaciterrulae]
MRGKTGLGGLAMALTIGMTPLPAAARDRVEPQPLTLERLFADPSLDGASLRAVRPSPDGRFVAYLKGRDDDAQRRDLWLVGRDGRHARMLVDTERLGSGAALSEAEKMRRERARLGGSSGLVDYSWSPDGSFVAFALDGDVYTVTLDGKTRRLTSSEASEIDLNIADDGRRISFVRDQNLFAVSLADGREAQITTDGKGTITCGTAEFVAQEEFGRSTGAWWSPAGDRIAFECFDESAVQVVTRTAIGAEGASTYDQRYPAAGTANATVSLWVANPDGSGRQKVDLGSDPDVYLVGVGWAADGRTLYVQRLNRDQKRLDLLAVDAASGAAKTLFAETAKTWVNVTGNLRPLKDGSLLWSSDRDGFMHLYRWADGAMTQLTRGTWTVQKLIGVDQAAHRAFFTANRDEAIEEHVYSIDYRAPGEPQRLTEAGFSNTAVMNKAGSAMIVTRSSPTQPPQVYAASADGRRSGWISENRIDAKHPYAPYLAAHRPVTFGTMTATDGSTLHYRMITPELEAGKRYPVFVEHYGGPTAQEVTREWMKPFAQYLVSKGWIYFQIDNRGSANRGRAFEDQIYHAMGTVEVEDQMLGARWLKAQPFVDPDAITIYGWSYGGYMTLKLLEKAPPGFYAAGIAGGSVTRWQLYDTGYTERYMGNPAVDPAPYEASNAIADAGRIRTPLLLIHGMSDDNVVFDHAAAVISKLQESDTPFEMMLYPGQTHRIAGPERQTHLWRTVERFLDRSRPKHAE